MPKYQLEDLVKHRRGMLLIDRIVSHDEDSVTAEVTITPQSTFFQQDHVPSWVGLEYAAQTVAALSGLRAKTKNQDMKVGLLLSCRRYQCTRPRFVAGDVLTIHAKEEFNDGQMGAYNCSIHQGAEEVATVSLSAYIPESINDLTVRPI